MDKKLFPNLTVFVKRETKHLHPPWKIFRWFWGSMGLIEFLCLWKTIFRMGRLVILSRSCTLSSKRDILAFWVGKLPRNWQKRWLQWGSGNKFFPSTKNLFPISTCNNNTSFSNSTSIPTSLINESVKSSLFIFLILSPNIFKLAKLSNRWSKLADKEHAFIFFEDLQDAAGDGFNFLHITYWRANYHHKIVPYILLFCTFIIISRSVMLCAFNVQLLFTIMLGS